MQPFPEVITHNYDPSRGAGQNVCNLPEANAKRVLEEINLSGHRRFKPDYFERRLNVERWLIAERLKKLGETPLQRPIYFFLGNFSDGKDLSRPASLIMQLSAFRKTCLTFTYLDSMTSFAIATQDNHKSLRRSYHGQVFSLFEIMVVVEKYGMPLRSSADETPSSNNPFIEVQVWDDEPIRQTFGRAPP